MSTKINKSYSWLVTGVLAVVIGGLVPLAVPAQTSQDKAPDVVARTETAPAVTAEARGVPKAPAPTSTYSWKGGYIGGHIGYGWGRANTSFTPLPTAAQFINLAPTTLRPDPSGFNGGAQGGYNWQSGSFVGGFEADISWSRMSGTAVMTPFTQNTGASFNGTLTAHQDTKWFGTLRPRVGGAFGKVFVYGTGGLAYGHVNYSANADFRPQGTIQYPAAISKTKAGWTAGGGVEVGINQHWSWKAEYLYYDLRKESFTANPVPANPPFQVAYTWETKAHTFNSGINYRF